MKTWGKLLGTFCTTAKLEMDLMYKIQIHCYEDAKLMKLFPEMVRALYDQDVLAEDTVLIWFRKGTNPKGRYVFQTRMFGYLFSVVIPQLGMPVHIWTLSGIFPAEMPLCFFFSQLLAPADVVIGCRP